MTDISNLLHTVEDVDGRLVTEDGITITRSKSSFAIGYDGTTWNQLDKRGAIARIARIRAAKAKEKA